MVDVSYKLSPPLTWPPANADGKPESAFFEVASSWQGLPLAHEGTDYRVVNKFTAIPTIEILASPASTAFWRLQAEALDGHVRLNRPINADVAWSSDNGQELLQAIENGAAGIFASAHFAIKDIFPRNTPQTPKWCVSGNGPWEYSKEVTYTRSHWIGQVGIDSVVGPLVEVTGEFTGKPYGHLKLTHSIHSQRVALASSASDSKYIYRAQNPDQRIQYDSSTGQFYLESISGAPITNVDVDVYRRQDVKLRTELPAPHFVNNDRAAVRKDQLSPLTCSVFDEARKLPVSAAQQLQWAAQKLAGSWEYDDSPAWGMLRISVAPEFTYRQLHQPNGIRKAHCEIAATEFFHAARAYGYNVRLIKGYMKIQSVESHAWVEFGDADGIHTIEATPAQMHAGGTKDQNSWNKYLEEGRAKRRETGKLLLMSDPLPGGSTIISMDRVQPILQLVTDVTAMGELQPVSLVDPPKNYDDVTLTPHATFSVLPTPQWYPTPQTQVVQRTYQNLENGDKIWWSTKLGQFVLQTASPGTPRQLRIFYVFKPCQDNPTLTICKAQEVPQLAPLKPKLDDVPTELRTIFEGLVPYVTYPNPQIALPSEAVLSAAFEQWEKLQKDSAIDQGRELYHVLTKGLPYIPPYIPELEKSEFYPTYKLLSFFNAVRAYGYPVTLEVKSTGAHSLDHSNLMFTLKFQNGRTTKVIVTVNGSIVYTDYAGLHQRMTWMDHPDTDIFAFIDAMKDQQALPDAKMFAGLDARMAKIPPLLVADRTHESSWESQFSDDLNMKYHPESSQYALPDLSQSALPENQPLKGWERVDLRGGSPTFQDQAGRRIVPRLPPGDAPSRPLLNDLKNIQGKPISVETLTAAHFQRVEHTGVFAQGQDLYYSPDLDLAVYPDTLRQSVMKNAKGQIIGFEWRFPVNANTNQVIPILRSDLERDPKDPRIYLPNGGSHYYYQALAPVLERLLMEMRQGGGLRSPQTDEEKAHVVAVYQQLMKTGTMYFNPYQESTMIAAMTYVVAEYQKLWEENNQGIFPETWLASACTPVELDHIPTGGTFCFPQQAPSPQSAMHDEWVRQLSKQAKYKTAGQALPKDILALYQAAAKWVPDTKQTPNTP